MKKNKLKNLKRDDVFYSFDKKRNKILKWKIINIKIFNKSNEEQRKIFEVKELEYKTSLKNDFYVSWVFLEKEVKKFDLSPDKLEFKYFKIKEQPLHESTYEDKVELRRKLIAASKNKYGE